ncbi:MAG: helix-turn-helix domain-containing protein [Bdellovibrionota bacterium]
MMMNEELVVAGLPLQFPKPTAGSQLPTLAEWNQRYIEYVLNFTKGKKTAAARILGINRRTLYRRKKNKVAQADVLRDGTMLDATMPGPSTQVQ